MRRPIVLLLSALSLLGLIDPIGLARAAAPTISSLSASYTYAQQMVFTASASSDAPLTNATVYFQSGNQPPYSRPADPFQPGTQVSLTATINLTETKLVPFSTVSYWWEVSDQAGQTTRSEARTLTYVDNRFAWHEITSGPVRVHWYQGDSGFAASAASVASEALPKIQQQLGVEPPSPIDVYIYATVDDLRSAVELAGRPWLGGQARPELGVVLVAIPPGDSARLQMRRDIPHELTHLMTFIATTPNYAAVPRWLDEGLATLNEGEPNAIQALAVQDALANSKLIPLGNLCGTFPADPSAALLAYGQSRAVMQEIVNEYGSAGIQALLAAYKDGATCAGGVERGLNTSLTGLELKWRSQLQPAPATGTPAAAPSGIGPWLVLIGVIVVPLVAWVLLHKPKAVTR